MAADDTLNERTQYTLLPGEGGNGERDANGKTYPTGVVADRGEPTVRDTNKARRDMSIGRNTTRARWAGERK